MFKYLDIGNSYLKIYNENEELMLIKNTKDNKIVKELSLFVDLNDYFIISSVDTKVSEIISNYFNQENIKYYFFGSKDYFLFFETTYKEILGLGEDRVINIVALKDKYPKMIVFDYGTALTVDVIDNEHYKTGYIYPGLESVLDALVNNADKLEGFEIKNYVDGPLLNTEDQINNSIILGFFGIINTINLVLSHEYNDEYKIFFTGGAFAKILNYFGEDDFRKMITCDYKYIEDLNFQGLRKVQKKIMG